MMGRAVQQADRKLAMLRADYVKCTGGWDATESPV